MQLTDLDKLNLIHICLKNEALYWHRQNKQKFVTWSIFVDEITKSFQSHMKQDEIFQKLKQYHQTPHQSVTQYYMEMIKLMKQADPDMNETTKIHYLINGLRPSLSIETRRKYPKNSEEFLTNAKVAEELTALNHSFTSVSFHGDESTSYSNTNDLNDSRRYTNVNNYYDNNNNINHSFHDQQQQHFINQISKQSSFNSSQKNLPSRSPPADKSTSRFSQPPLNDNTRRNYNYNQQQQQQQQPSRRCFKCNSPNHIARNCHHFENRGQW